MTHSGRCHCGAIRYQTAGAPKDVVRCHCVDCRRSSGAPMVAWAGFAESDLAIAQGNRKTVNSSGTAMRSFCANCGAGRRVDGGRIETFPIGIDAREVETAIGEQLTCIGVGPVAHGSPVEALRRSAIL